jgi:hypothetical protein
MRDDVMRTGMPLRTHPAARDSVLIVSAILLVWLAWPASSLASPACSSSWHAVRSPSPAHQPSDANQLSGVASVSSTEAWAVGWFDHAADTRGPKTLAERWHQGRWTVVRTPNPPGADAYLNAVAASGPSDVWAVGIAIDDAGYRSLVEHWNGSAWSLVPAATFNNVTLNGVVALAPDDVWAVGSLLEHWDGAAWTTFSIGASNFFRDLSAQGSAGIWAAGNHYVQPVGPLLTNTAHFDGVSWNRIRARDALRDSTDDENDLLGISDVGPDDVWAVGQYGDPDSGPPAHTLVEHWNGTRWRIVPSPDPGGDGLDDVLWDVHAFSTDDAWAVGTTGSDGSPSNQTLIERWDGSHWSTAGSPPLGVLLRIAGDDASRSAWAVGYTEGAGFQATLIEHACGI